MFVGVRPQCSALHGSVPKRYLPKDFDAGKGQLNRKKKKVFKPKVSITGGGGSVPLRRNSQPC